MIKRRNEREVEARREKEFILFRDEIQSYPSEEGLCFYDRREEK